MTTPALLLFAHQARSYAAMIKDYADRLGVAVVVLSSKPRDVRDLEQLAALGVARLWHVDDEHLDASHVPPVLAQASAEGFTIVAALATFEGYRALMALTNQRLGAIDADPAALKKCMDKFLCRQALVERGLSRSSATVLDAQTLPALRTSGRKLFVKPRRSAGSFACFRLDDTLSIDRLHALQQQMRDDLAFRAIFAGQFDFIAEDYVHGDEYSLEVLVVGGESHVIGVHAKYLDDSSGTTQQLAGEHFVDECLLALHLREGCYPIEARHDPRDGHWDLIEINARMGGALINQSVGVFTGGLSMLELWVRTLCSVTGAARSALRCQLGALRESTRRRNKTMEHGTVFFSRYGERNRTLETLSIDQLTPQPDIVEIPARQGTRLPDSERGIFILNALWKVCIPDIAHQLQALSTMLDEKLVVRYSDAAASAANLAAKEKP